MTMQKSMPLCQVLVLLASCVAVSNAKPALMRREPLIETGITSDGASEKKFASPSAGTVELANFIEQQDENSEDTSAWQEFRSKLKNPCRALHPSKFNCEPGYQCKLMGKDKSKWAIETKDDLTKVSMGGKSFYVKGGNSDKVPLYLLVLKKCDSSILVTAAVIRKGDDVKEESCSSTELVESVGFNEPNGTHVEIEAKLHEYTVDGHDCIEMSESKGGAHGDLCLLEKSEADNSPWTIPNDADQVTVNREDFLRIFITGDFDLLKLDKSSCPSPSFILADPVALDEMPMLELPVMDEQALDDMLEISHDEDATHETRNLLNTRKNTNGCGWGRKNRACRQARRAAKPSRRNADGCKAGAGMTAGCAVGGTILAIFTFGMGAAIAAQCLAAGVGMMTTGCSRGEASSGPGGFR